MFSSEFERKFRRLLTAAIRYHNTPRDPADIATLGSARIQLDDARTAVANVRPNRSSAAVGRAQSRSDLDDDQLALVHIRSVGLTSG